MEHRAERARSFRALHEGPAPFLIPNPWDAGSTRLLESLGFEAVATTSLGVAISLGKKRLSRDDVLTNCRVVCSATDLPVNADLENGFGDAPEVAAECVVAAAECGAVGASIEDVSQGPEQKIYDLSLAVERVAACVEAAAACPVPILLTARAENLLHGIDDLDDTIRRLQAFEEAGADVLYAPGLRTLEEMTTVVSAVSRPVNVVMGFADPGISHEQLAEVGVRRVSIGGALLRLAMRSFMRGAAEMRAGRFGFVEDIATSTDLGSFFAA